MNITASHINYYHICHRKLWLFINGINMEHTSDTVYEGKLLHENSYGQRAEKNREISISFSLDDENDLYGQIDFYDAKNKVIHEIKKSDKMEEAHEWQLKYYIWLLALNGITDVTGILEYPKLRETKEVKLLEKDINYLKLIIHNIIALGKNATCPDVINSKICKKCSYFELCYVIE